MSGIMSGISSHEVSLVDVFDRLGDNEVISVRAGDLKEFVRQIDEDAAEPSLPFACRGIEHEATLLGRHLAPGDNEEVICDITWLREDVVRACEHVYGVELNRADNGVEEMIDGVLAEIGDGLQDRSTEFGYELIYEHLPAWEEVLKLAPRNVALAAEADSLIREYWGSAYEILLDDATAGDEAAFYVAAPKDESEGGRVDQPTAVFIAYAGDFDGDAYTLCNAAIDLTGKVDALACARETEEQAQEAASRMLGNPSEISSAARSVAGRSGITDTEAPTIHR